MYFSWPKKWKSLFYRKTSQRAIMVTSWSVSKQGDRPPLSCPDDNDEHLTNNSNSNLYLSLPRSPGHWPVATGDWVTRLHNIIIISVAALHLSISSTPGQGCFVQAAADLSIVVNCSNSSFFVRLKYCAGHQRGSERGDDGKMFTDKIQIKSLHHSLVVTARQSAPQTISIKIINTQNQARADKIVNLSQCAGKW